MKPTKKLDDLLLKLLNEQPDGIRMTDFEKILKDRLISRGVTDYYQVGSPHTIIEALKRLKKQGYAKTDEDSRKYVITAEGEKYVPKSEIVDFILSSKWFDSYFSWNTSSKEPEIAAYNLVQSENTHPLAYSMTLLGTRLEKTKITSWESWLNDILDYAKSNKMLDGKTEMLDTEFSNVLVKMEEGHATTEDIVLFKQKLASLWKILFNGVERLTVVQTVSPQLLFERINLELSLPDQK